MRRALPLLLVFLALCGAGFYAYQTSQKDAPQSEIVTPVPVDEIDKWAHESSDIPVNERAIFGHLVNGMRYVIVPNAEPKERVSLRLHVDAGSLQEADDQRGLAHFLEHMVFNGSKNFTPDELIPQMQRLGISFGAHANAYTSFDETVYMLDLPETSEQVVDLAFTVMRDFADGALLEPEEIDKERGVILSEKNSRDSVSYRLMIQKFKDLLPDSRVTRRIPIGTEEVISNAPRERFADFYDTYYIPRDMTFVIVGDIDPAKAERRIRESFATLQNPQEPTPELDLGSVAESEGFQTYLYSDKEVTSTRLSLTSIAQPQPITDTRAQRASEIAKTLAHAIINRRFQEIAKQEDSPILGGSSSDYDLVQAAHISSIDVTAADGRAADAIAVLEREYRRALSFGFTQFELDLVRDEILSRYERAVETEPTRQSASIADEIISGINAGIVFSDAATDLEVLREPLAQLLPGDCHAAFLELWGERGSALIVTTNDSTRDSEDALVAAYKRSQSEAVTPYAEAKRKEWAYNNFGPAGEPSVTQIDDLGITQIAFPNGVRANLKATDFEKDSISIRIDINGGDLTMPLTKPGLNVVAGQVFNAGGLGKYTADELRSVLAGRDVTAVLGIAEGQFILSGATTPADLVLQLQLMTATLTDPGYRPEALRQFQSFIPMIYANMEHSEQGALTAIDAYLHGDDPRHGLPLQEQMTAITMEDVREWMTPALSTGYLEISIVGDLDIEETTNLLSRTLGALPQRNIEPIDLSDLARIQMPTPPEEKTYIYNSRLTKAVTLVHYPTTGINGDIQRTRRLNLLASIFGDRLREKLREELGATYSPRAGSTQSDAYPTFGTISATSTGKPADTTRVANVIRDIADELAGDGVTADEFDRALQPALGQLRESLRQNSYWLSAVLSFSQAEPEKLEWARTRDADYQSITAEELSEYAAGYLGAERALTFQILPKAKE